MYKQYYRFKTFKFHLFHANLLEQNHLVFTALIHMLLNTNLHMILELCTVISRKYAHWRGT